jgi:hypothetical protein
MNLVTFKIDRVFRRINGTYQGFFLTIILKYKPLSLGHSNLSCFLILLQTFDLIFETSGHINPLDKLCLKSFKHFSNILKRLIIMINFSLCGFFLLGRLRLKKGMRGFGNIYNGIIIFKYGNMRKIR